MQRRPQAEGKERHRLGGREGKEQPGQLQSEERRLKNDRTRNEAQRESEGCHSSDISHAKRSSTAAVCFVGAGGRTRCGREEEGAGQLSYLQKGR